MPVASHRRDAIKDSAWFIDELRAVSPGNLRALWLPYPSDTTTNLLSPDGRVWTNSASNAGRVTYQGNGILVSFNGTDQYVTTPITSDLQITGALTLVALTKGSTPAAGDDGLIGTGYSGYHLTRFTNGNAFLYIGAGANNLGFAVPAGDLVKLVSASWDGTTNANGMTGYVNGAPIGQGTSNGTSPSSWTDPIVGARTTAADYWSGSEGFAAIYAAALTAAQHARIANLCREFYEVSL